MQPVVWPHPLFVDHQTSDRRMLLPLCRLSNVNTQFYFSLVWSDSVDYNLETLGMEMVQVTPLRRTLASSP